MEKKELDRLTNRAVCNILDELEISYIGIRYVSVYYDYEIPKQSCRAALDFYMKDDKKLELAFFDDRVEWLYFGGAGDLQDSGRIELDTLRPSAPEPVKEQVSVLDKIREYKYYEHIMLMLAFTGNKKESIVCAHTFENGCSLDMKHGRIMAECTEDRVSWYHASQNGQYHGSLGNIQSILFVLRSNDIEVEDIIEIEPLGDTLEMVTKDDEWLIKFSVDNSIMVARNNRFVCPHSITKKVFKVFHRGLNRKADVIVGWDEYQVKKKFKEINGYEPGTIIEVADYPGLILP